MPPRRPQDAPGTPFPAPPARAPVPKEERRARRAYVELLLTLGYPVEELPAALRLWSEDRTHPVGPKAARATVERVLDGGAEVVVRRRVADDRRQDRTMLEHATRMLMFHPPGATRIEVVDGKEVRINIGDTPRTDIDPAKLAKIVELRDRLGLRRLLEVPKGVSKSVQKRLGAQREVADGCDAPELLGDDGGDDGVDGDAD